jgi:hypothetical protein
MLQFALISLIPGLIRRLEDCADPELDSYERNMVAPTSLKTSERSSRKHIYNSNSSANIVSSHLHGLTFADIWKGANYLV